MDVHIGSFRRFNRKAIYQDAGHGWGNQEGWPRALGQFQGVHPTPSLKKSEEGTVTRTRDKEGCVEGWEELSPSVVERNNQGNKLALLPWCSPPASPPSSSWVPRG